MRNPEYSSQFKRDYKKMKSRGKNTALIKSAMAKLLAGEALPEAYKDHQLKGEWKDFRELHIESDWLLIYKIIEDTIYFTRTGSHSDLFDE